MATGAASQWAFRIEINSPKNAQTRLSSVELLRPSQASKSEGMKRDYNEDYFWKSV